MSNAGSVARPGKGFGGASQWSQDDRIEGKSLTKEEQAEIDKLKQEIEEYKGKVESYEAKLKEYEAEIKEYKAEIKEYEAAGRREEAGRCQEIILELYAGIRQKEVLIQELYAGIQRKEALILKKDTRKRKRAVDAADDTLGSKFMRVFPKASWSGKLISFHAKLFKNQDAGNVMFVRPCFEELYDMIVGELKSREEIGSDYLNVRVTGTPGIGKTVCGLYVMLRLLVEADKTVVYLDGYDFHKKEGDAYLLGPKGSTIVHDAREKGHQIEESDEQYWWGRIMTQSSEGQNLLDWLLGKPELWCVLDSPKTGITIPTKYSCIKAVFSSPHRATRNTLKGSELLFYMPLWDLEELRQANQELKLGISDSELEDRFMRFGGIARWVLAKDSTYAMTFFDANITELTFQKAQEVLDPYSGSADLSSLFIHIVPSEDFRSRTTRVSTDLVARHVTVQAALSENWNMRQWAEVASRWGLKNAAGNVFECVWHNAMALGRETPIKCKLRNLESKETTAATTVETPSLPHPAKTFVNNKMTDLEILKEGQYCLPLTPNFETVDSWLVMRKPFVDERNENLCLVQFQVTTAQSHPLRQAGEMRVIQKAESLFGVKNWEACNIYIVFVVLHANFSGFKKQKWTTAEDEEIKQPQGNLLKHIRQLALAIPQELEPHARRMSL